MRLKNSLTKIASCGRKYPDSSHMHFHYSYCSKIHVSIIHPHAFHRKYLRFRSKKKKQKRQIY